MKFRQFTEKQPILTPSLLAEADLLAKPSPSSTGSPPSKGTTITPDGPVSPKAGPDQPSDNGHPLGSGREPRAMDDQLREAGLLATKLLKTLMRLPPPWNKGFHAFLLPLQGLARRLQQIS